MIILLSKSERIILLSIYPIMALHAYLSFLLIHLKKKYTIFHFIDGSSSKTELDLSAILPFANFINLINNKLDHKNYKYNAIDSAYSDKEHFHNVYQRLSLYIEFAKKHNDLDYEKKIFNNCKIFLDKYFDENKPLSSSKNEIILSPSDFGIQFKKRKYAFVY